MLKGINLCFLRDLSVEDGQGSYANCKVQPRCIGVTILSVPDAGTREPGSSEWLELAVDRLIYLVLPLAIATFILTAKIRVLLPGYPMIC